DIGLSMQPAGDVYECRVWKPVVKCARLPIPSASLASKIDAARRELMKVVWYRDAADEKLFQTRIDIPDADRAVALKTMARAGALLLEDMFFGSAGADARAVGEFLRKRTSDRTTRLKLQIVAERTPVPWGLLYVGDASGTTQLEWDNFIGMRHVIEQI